MKPWFKRQGLFWVPVNLEGWATYAIYLGFLGLTIWESYRPQRNKFEMIRDELPTWVFLTLFLFVIIYFRKKDGRI